MKYRKCHNHATYIKNMATYECPNCEEMFCEECVENYAGECPNCEPPRLVEIGKQELLSSQGDK